MQTPPPAVALMQITSGHIASAALYVATRLDIAGQLAGGPRSAAELAAATGMNEDALYRVLRLLSSLGVFEEAGPRRFALSPISQLLRKDVPDSLYGMTLFLPDPHHFRVYANLLDSVRTGVPAADTTFGQPLFEYMQRDREWSEIFNDAMTAFSAQVIPAALEVYDFSRFRKVIDIAGGHGHVLMSILKANPQARGVLAEVDHVVEGAKPRIAAAGLADRCEAVVCDFFSAVPAGGDLYVMKHIIHDWDDERAALILRNIASAMGNTRGSVVLLEAVIPEGTEPSLGKVVDIEMLAFPGGRERTEAEFRALFARSGFELTRVLPTRSPLSVVEAVRAP